MCLPASLRAPSTTCFKRLLAGLTIATEDIPSTVSVFLDYKFFDSYLTLTDPIGFTLFRGPSPPPSLPSPLPFPAHSPKPLPFPLPLMRSCPLKYSWSRGRKLLQRCLGRTPGKSNLVHFSLKINGGLAGYFFRPAANLHIVNLCMVTKACVASGCCIF